MAGTGPRAAPAPRAGSGCDLVFPCGRGRGELRAALGASATIKVHEMLPVLSCHPHGWQHSGSSRSGWGWRHGAGLRGEGALLLPVVVPKQSDASGAGWRPQNPGPA